MGVPQQININDFLTKIGQLTMQLDSLSRQYNSLLTEKKAQDKNVELLEEQLKELMPEEEEEKEEAKKK